MSLLCLLVIYAAISFGQQLKCQGKPNLLPIWTGAPTLIKTVPNGKLFSLVNDVQPNIAVLHVWGTPYQMGYAYGQLLGPQIKQLMSEVMTFIEDQVMQFLHDLPEFLQRIIAGTVF